MPKEQVLSLRELRPTMVLLPVGEFQMGRATNDLLVDAENLYADELPPHRVEMKRAYAMSETEVTQGQYQAVMGANPSDFAGKPDSARRPVENVSWYDAVEYCNKLSEREILTKCYEIEGKEVKWPQGLDCTGYRLPTEAEWEYAARADQGTVYAGSNKAEEVAWFSNNSNKETHEVKNQEKMPNQWGLYDLSGNVWEWVWDEYAPYKAEYGKNPVGSRRVFRGGSWYNGASDVRISNRNRFGPGARDWSLGFRIVKSTGGTGD